MAWARVSDDFHDHDKVTALTVDVGGLAALGLWTLALAWVRKDRRRRGVVPLGQVLRFGAGDGKQLASRLVAVGLWEEVETGYRFHDFEDVYDPPGLSEKRAEAGRSGGKASGVSRREKQPASKDTPDEGKDEANPKQLASLREAKRREASRTRAGSTTHYPKENYAAPTELPASPPARAANARDPSDTQRSKRITDAYAAAEPLCKWPAVNAIVLKAIKSGRYTDDEIRDALLRLAKDGRGVTVETLRVELAGLTPGVGARASPNSLRGRSSRDDPDAYSGKNLEFS